MLTTHNQTTAQQSKTKRHGFIQPNLVVGQANDQHEQEADKVAARIVQKKGQPETFFKPIVNSISSVQRKCAACEKDKKKNIQRKEKGSTDDCGDVDPLIADATSGGSPMDNITRSFMESGFGYDFSNVKIHTNTIAAKSAQAINAHAYTSGNDIVFNHGQYSPGTDYGKKLLAHELTHVVQQNFGSYSKKFIQRKSIREEVPHLDSFIPGGVYSGSVDRYEYENKAAYNERLAKNRMNAFFRSNVKVKFDSSRCVLEVPVAVNFINNKIDGQTNCSGSPERKNPVSQDRFDAAKLNIMSLIPESLDNWFNIHLSNPKITGCSASNIPIKVVLREDSSNADFEIFLTANEGTSNVRWKGGANGLSGGQMVLCGSAISDNDTIIHEGGHMVLGTGDEYRKTGRPKSRERTGEHSRMAQDGAPRLLAFYERHFQFAPAFMNSVFPGCGASLASGSRKSKIEFSPEFAGGVLTTNQGNGPLFLSLGLQFGIPLTKMRELTFQLGPQIEFLYEGSRAYKQTNILSLLLGLKAGLKYKKHIGTLPGQVSLGLVGDISGQAGALMNFADNPGGLPARRVTPYVERTASLGFDFESRVSVGVEIGKGMILPGGSKSDIEYYKFGLKVGASF